MPKSHGLFLVTCVDANIPTLMSSVYEWIPLAQGDNILTLTEQCIQIAADYFQAQASNA